MIHTTWSRRSLNIIAHANYHHPKLDNRFPKLAFALNELMPLETTNGVEQQQQQGSQASMTHLTMRIDKEYQQVRVSGDTPGRADALFVTCTVQALGAHYSWGVMQHDLDPPPPEGPQPHLRRRVCLRRNGGDLQGCFLEQFRV